MGHATATPTRGEPLTVARSRPPGRVSKRTLTLPLKLYWHRVSAHSGA